MERQRGQEKANRMRVLKAVAASTGVKEAIDMFTGGDESLTEAFLESYEGELTPEAF